MPAIMAPMEQKPLTPREFSELAEEVLGKRWQTRLARAIGKDGSTVRRWASGAVAVPDYITAMLELLREVPAAFRPARWGK